MAAESPTYKIGRRVFTVLFPDLLRPLTGPERAALKRSIRKSGVQTPILVDENDGVVDGGNRVAIAAEVGIKNVPTAGLTRTGMTLEEKAEIALQVNHARRHLSGPDWKKMESERAERVARAAEMRRQGMSLRAIAEAEGVSHPQIIADLRAAEATTGNPLPVAPEKVTGMDGRTVKATRGTRPVRESVSSTTPAASEQPAVVEDVLDGACCDNTSDAPLRAEDAWDGETQPIGLTRLIAAWAAATSAEKSAFDAMRASGRI